MEYCSKLVFSLCSVLVLTSTCYGCYTNYQTCFDDFRAIQLSSSSNLNNYSTVICNAVIDAVTCLENDASDCTDSDTAPSLYVSYKDTFTNQSTSCKDISKQVVCSNKLRNCANQTLEAAKLIQGGSSDESLFNKSCQGIETGLQCYRELTPLCPFLEEQLNQTVQSYEALFSSLCSVEGKNAGVCHGHLLSCSNQATQEYNALIPLVQDLDDREVPDKSVLDRICRLIKTTKHCLRDIQVCPSDILNNTVAQFEAQFNKTSARCNADGQNPASTTAPGCDGNDCNSGTMSASTTAPGCDGNDCNSGTMSVVNLMVTFLGVTLALI